MRKLRGGRASGSVVSVLVLGLLGSVFLAVGVFTGVFAARWARAEADRAEALPSLSLAALEDGRPGAEALIEGVLSARNPPRFREFVAYVREEYRGTDDDGDSVWAEDERATPRLLIELGGGVAQLGNDDYQLSGFHETWRDGDVLRWDGLSGGGTKRYAGLLAGRPVTAIGVIREGPEGNELWAATVYGGTREAYLAGQRNAARFLPIFGLIFGGIGALLLGIAAWIGLRP